MPNKYYLRGRAAEYELKKRLEEGGWEVFRTAGSHGRADLVAVKDGTYRLIQIKTCQETDIKKYEKEKVPGVELHIKIMHKGWKVLD